MKQFARYFAINLGIFVFLAVFVLFVEPDILPGDPPATFIDHVREWIAYPFALLFGVFAFPVILWRSSFPLPEFLPFLLTPTLWTVACVCFRREWKRHRATV